MFDTASIVMALSKKKTVSLSFKMISQDLGRYLDISIKFFYSLLFIHFDEVLLEIFFSELENVTPPEVNTNILKSSTLRMYS